MAAVNVVSDLDDLTGKKGTVNSLCDEPKGHLRRRLAPWDLINFLFDSSCICTCTKTAFHKHEVAALHTVKAEWMENTLTRSIISRMDFTPWIPDSGYWIPSLSVELGFWIPIAVGFRIPKPRIPKSPTKLFSDSGIRIPSHGALSCLIGFFLFSCR